jgi:hypothetical protein
VNLRRRVGRLEAQTRAAQKKPLTVVVSKVWKPLNLATSTCKRTLYPSGTLINMVDLDGSRDGLSDEDLYRFIAKFPIETPTERKT